MISVFPENTQAAPFSALVVVLGLTSTHSSDCIRIRPCKTHLPAIALLRLFRRCRRMPPWTMRLNGFFSWARSRPDWPSSMRLKAFRTKKRGAVSDCNAHCLVATIIARSGWNPQIYRKDSERYADLTVARIFAAAERLINFPHSGRVVPERDEPGIREIIVGRFRVVYRIRNATVEFVTVFQASRGLPENV